MGVPYEEQLRKKQASVIRLLGKFGHVDPIRGMENPMGCRCKATRTFSYDGKRTFSGIYEPASHRLVPVTECPMEHPAASAVLRTIHSLAVSLRIPAYNEENGTGFLRHVLVRVGAATGEILVVVVAAEPIFKQQKLFVQKLLAAHPAIRSVVLNVNPRFTPIVLGSREKVLFGPGYIEDRLSGLTFRISSRSFFQVNPAQAEVLYGLAMEMASLTGKERVLDAYCGTGTIGLTASLTAGEVMGVELTPDAVKDAIANARRNHIRSARFYTGDAGEFLEALAAEKEPADVVFLDPPRSGSDERFLSSLLTMSPQRIVYISCSPDTLARDLETLTRGGYLTKRIVPVDMFPFTRHVETVVLMSRVKE